MRIFSFIAAFALAGGLSAATFEVDTTHSSVGFEVKHLMLSKVKGDFKKFNGEIELDGKNLKKLEGEVSITEINTNNDSRDKHLNAPDFFDSSNFPTATLKMTKATKKKLYADLTIRGITKNVSFDFEMGGPVKHPKTGKDLISLSLQGVINRKDFKVGENTGDSSVSEKVNININIEATSK
ncbi:MAG: YceI family protein [Helicobacter sp.]|uniref:YceI family protein n=1 Tax=Helicobacter sp. 10-6591 TaxID=2004998 RepID=UPI000DCCC4BC|nr:YceI family protein [Helicobacter sp. 10-6591]MCI6217161.1 YceI family protein [Helicobacter sp.]MCI7484654.1 YceI family protein [Helicobacter sp.]MDD7567771.1 YceI family protein [Helicobacter sp.]MDY5741078.1 YceI family protein [Helicobacter sp.]RAX55948.1 polyisoprenoid-binding protein [Helicobacter sp. 10-6591]